MPSLAAALCLAFSLSAIGLSEKPSEGTNHVSPYT